MLLNKRVKSLEEDTTRSFDNVSTDMDFVFKVLNSLESKLDALNNKIATNGVVRDIRDLQKRVLELEDEKNDLKITVNRLSDEVFCARKEKKYNLTGYDFAQFWALGHRHTPVEEATLSGKVDAIIEHLKLNIEVTPEEVKEAKPVAKKVSTKKKGRR